MLSLNVRTPVHENNHTSHRVQDPSLIRISQQFPYFFQCIDNYFARFVFLKFLAGLDGNGCIHQGAGIQANEPGQRARPQLVQH